MFPSLRLRRSNWKDLFIARELPALPLGPDRYAMLFVKAVAGILGTLVITLGPIAALLQESQGISTSTYGYVVGGVGMASAFAALVSANLADRFSRVRVLLWGMVPPIALMFALGFLPNHQPVLFILIYVLIAWADAYAIVTVSALLRDFSPRTGRGLGVGLVTVGTNAATWIGTFMAGHLLSYAGTWQHMYLLYAYVAVAIWLFLWLFAREPSAGIRIQVVPSQKDAAVVERRAREMESAGSVKVMGFWQYIRADWRLWVLAAGQGLFLMGYITFVSYGPLFTIKGFDQTPQDAAALTSWVFLSIIVFLILGGVLSDVLRMRKLLGAVFTVVTGILLLILALLIGTKLGTSAIVALYVAIGASMALMWSPCNALFSETAEDIHASRQTTAFGGNWMVIRFMYYGWILLVPVVLSLGGWGVVWVVCGLASIATAPVLLVCRGPWGRFKVQRAEEANEALYAQVVPAPAIGVEAVAVSLPSESVSPEVTGGQAPADTTGQN